MNKIAQTKQKIRKKGYFTEKDLAGFDGIKTKDLLPILDKFEENFYKKNNHKIMNDDRPNKKIDAIHTFMADSIVSINCNILHDSPFTLKKFKSVKNKPLDYSLNQDPNLKEAVADTVVVKKTKKSTKVKNTFVQAARDEFGDNLEENNGKPTRLGKDDFICVADTSIDQGYELPKIEGTHNLKLVKQINSGSDYTTYLYKKVKPKEPAYVLYSNHEEATLIKY